MNDSHDRKRRARAFLASLAASALRLGIVAAVLLLPAAWAQETTVTFSDSTYADASWTVVNSFQYAAAFSGQQASGGNPGSYRQTVLGVAQNVGFVGQLNNGFVFDPGSAGAITGIAYDIDLITTNAAGSAYAALLLQDGRYYLDTSETATATSNTWAHHRLLLDLAHFSELTIVNNALHLVPSMPDFSSSGAPIVFGYEVIAGGGGFFQSVTGIDNDPITLTVLPAAVSPAPEPSTVSSLAAGLVLLGYLLRRTGRPAQPR